jgi:uncharacterized repeat protein (TIGR03803 family)
MQPKKFCSPAKAIFAVFVTCWLAATLAGQPAQAQTFKVLHTFHGTNGAGPVGRLVRDKAGNLYGTTGAGGVGKCNGSFDNRCGTAFKVDKTGKQVWLHSFNGNNGQEPLAGLLPGSGGNLYGTTYLGGDTACYSLGCGTVFRLDPNGKEKLLYQFTGTPDGWFPQGPLTLDAAGNLYGTTQQGGSSGGYGTAFRVDKIGTETVLYSFTGGSDGCYPDAVVLDAAGNLYGVAGSGGIAFCGSGYGVVFKLDPAGVLTVLHAFSGGDGAYPSSVLIFDAAGNLYGTTYAGGSSQVCNGGCGTVFELSPDQNGSWTESVLYSFCSVENCADGLEPNAGLVRDGDGNLYGTTDFGGTSQCSGAGCGVLFEVGSVGSETVLHSFTGGQGGFQPSGSLVRNPAGTLYGVATGGGDTRCFPPEGCGVVFKFTP